MIETTTTRTAYQVVYRNGKGKAFANLQDAVIFAREKAKSIGNGQVVPIWMGGLVIGIVTDDANSLTLHRLTGWPEDAVCAYE
jgi:hypothetical protein